MSIPTVATPAHVRRQIVGPAETLPVITAILFTLITVHHHAFGRFTSPDYHITGKQIDDHGKIEQAMSRVRTYSDYFPVSPLRTGRAPLPK